LTGTQHLVYRTPDGKEQTADIKAGQILLCPAGVPHSPRLEPDSWFIVFERKRRPGEIDHFKWFCNSCGEKVYETAVEVGDYRQENHSARSRLVAAGSKARQGARAIFQKLRGATARLAKNHI